MTQKRCGRQIWRNKYITVLLVSSTIQKRIRLYSKGLNQIPSKSNYRSRYKRNPKSKEKRVQNNNQQPLKVVWFGNTGTLDRKRELSLTSWGCWQSIMQIAEMKG